MDMTSVPSQNPDTAARLIDDKVFVLHPDTSELHALNEVGARIWDLADGVRAVADIVAAVEAEYDVSAQTAETDTVTFLDELAAKGLITLA